MSSSSVGGPVPFGVTSANLSFTGTPFAESAVMKAFAGDETSEVMVGKTSCRASGKDEVGVKGGASAQHRPFRLSQTLSPTRMILTRTLTATDKKLHDWIDLMLAHAWRCHSP